MRLVKVFGIGLAAMLMMVGCADKGEGLVPKVGMADLENMPAWVMDPQVENGIGAVGISKFSKHGMKVMVNKAEMDGRTKLAAEIQTEVSRLSKNTLRQANINDLDVYEEQFAEATVNLVKKIPLSGAKRVAMHQDKSTGELYVHMVLEKRAVSDFMQENKNMIQQQLEAKMTRNQLDDAMDVMDKMIGELNESVSE